MSRWSIALFVVAPNCKTLLSFVLQYGMQSETSAPMDKSFFDRVMVIVNSNQAVIAQREREEADEARRLEQAREARVARMNRQLAWGEDGAPAAPIEGPRPRRRAQRPNVHAGFVVIDE
jgi:hypothetical protein